MQQCCIGRRLPLVPRAYFAFGLDGSINSRFHHGTTQGDVEQYWLCISAFGEDLYNVRKIYYKQPVLLHAFHIWWILAFSAWQMALLRLRSY